MRTIAEKVKQLRLAKGLHQYEVADKMNMSRPTYMLVESGKKQLTIPQLQILVSILGSSLEEVLFDAAQANTNDVGLGKYKQIILNCLQWGGDAVDGKITKTKLAKLAYLADFTWFYNQHHSMSGLSYRRIQQGPVPDQYFRVIDELFGAGAINIQASGTALMIKANDTNAPTSLLSDNEVELIKKISQKWQKANTQEVVDFTHNQAPWISCKQGELVPYELILQENADNLY